MIRENVERMFTVMPVFSVLLTDSSLRYAGFLSAIGPMTFVGR